MSSGLRIHNRRARSAALRACMILMAIAWPAAAQGTPTSVTIIAGTVTGGNGGALAGATVGARSLQTMVTRWTTTNANGQYTILFNDTSSTFRVTVSAAAHAPQVIEVKRQAGDDRIVVNARLREGSTPADTFHLPEIFRIALAADSMGRPLAARRKLEITGTVTDQADKPVVGAKVAATTLDGNRAADGAEEAWIWTATTDEKGHYALSLPGTVTNFGLTVTAIGFARIAQNFTSRSGEPKVVVNVKMGVGATFISSPYPRTIVPRGQLGSTDAADFWIGEGDITVTGTDDDFVSYQVVATPGTRATSHPEDFGIHIVSGFGTRVAGGPGANLIVTVPRSLKTLKLTAGHSGAIHVDHFNGELTVSSEQGTVDLADVSGPTLVEARDGAVTVSFAKLPVDGAHGLSVLGRNGDVTVTVPEDAKASFSLEVHRGTASSAFAEGNSRIVIDAADLEAFSKLAPGVAPQTAGIPRKFIYDINGGGVLVQVVALNGNIIVRKSVKPPPPTDEVEQE